jgi:hypothetical protein
VIDPSKKLEKLESRRSLLQQAQLECTHLHHKLDRKMRPSVNLVEEAIRVMLCDIYLEIPNVEGNLKKEAGLMGQFKEIEVLIEERRKYFNEVEEEAQKTYGRDCPYCHRKIPLGEDKCAHCEALLKMASRFIDDGEF